MIVDANEHYGETGATLSLPEFRAWLDDQAQQSPVELDENAQQATPEHASDMSAPKEIPLRAGVPGTVRDVHSWFRHESAQPGSKFCIDLAHQVRSVVVCPSSTLQSSTGTVACMPISTGLSDSFRGLAMAWNAACSCHML